ncbi:unnamed protein product [Cyclocybe aegerita]|uniref:Uncharacterized protein n=1 Tax=Cyclocybe aegerita TaxID=1973307 RepID=A0A8S0WD66_CYCAE|nr:unnamed protein product [Cyclocybe aegerita]
MLIVVPASALSPLQLGTSWQRARHETSLVYYLVDRPRHCPITSSYEMPSTRYSASPRKYINSSDTEPFDTPPRKRLRPADDDGSPSKSSSASSSPRKRQRKSRKIQSQDVELEQILRDCLVKPTSHDAILRLKEVPRDEGSLRFLVKFIMHDAKRPAMHRWKQDQMPLLETELYAQWLEGLDDSVSAIEIALCAKVPGTRKRVKGLGRASYHLLYNVIDEFIDEVNAHHDGFSLPSPEDNLYPPTMTLAEEANDPSTDDRSEEAVRQAEVCLKKFDRVMADAVRRYKVECGRSNPSLASRISDMEYSLARGCCLLCEQTGFGSNESDMGFSLMQETREVMTHWKSEYDNCEDQLVDSD